MPAADMIKLAEAINITMIKQTGISITRFASIINEHAQQSAASSLSLSSPSSQSNEGWKIINPRRRGGRGGKRGGRGRSFPSSFNNNQRANQSSRLVPSSSSSSSSAPPIRSNPIDASASMVEEQGAQDALEEKKINQQRPNNNINNNINNNKNNYKNKSIYGAHPRTTPPLQFKENKVFDDLAVDIHFEADPSSNNPKTHSSARKILQIFAANSPHIRQQQDMWFNFNKRIVGYDRDERKALYDPSNCPITVKAFSAPRPRPDAANGQRPITDYFTNLNKASLPFLSRKAELYQEQLSNPILARLSFASIEARDHALKVVGKIKESLAKVGIIVTILNNNIIADGMELELFMPSLHRAVQSNLPIQEAVLNELNREGIPIKPNELFILNSSDDCRNRRGKYIPRILLPFRYIKSVVNKLGDPELNYPRIRVSGLRPCMGCGPGRFSSKPRCKECNNNKNKHYCFICKQSVQADHLGNCPSKHSPTRCDICGIPNHTALGCFGIKIPTHQSSVWKTFREAAPPSPAAAPSSNNNLSLSADALAAHDRDRPSPPRSPSEGSVRSYADVLSNGSSSSSRASSNRSSRSSSPSRAELNEFRDHLANIRRDQGRQSKMIELLFAKLAGPEAAAALRASAPSSSSTNRSILKRIRPDSTADNELDTDTIIVEAEDFFDESKRNNSIDRVTDGSSQYNNNLAESFMDLAADPVSGSITSTSSSSTPSRVIQGALRN
jgi:hypothetical protein